MILGNDMTNDFRYDVALSFLSKDLDLAKNLASRLEPGLSVFVYDRHKEDLLGSDGMERFSVVFAQEARLSVILFREGWGHTPWTAFEETHIKSRALLNRMTSFMLVALDSAPHPAWVPASHLYASIETESRDEIAAIIRARAREQGAVSRKDSAAEFALRQKRAQDAARRRDDRFQSSAAIQEVRAEVERLFADIARTLDEIRASDSTIDVDYGKSSSECGIARPDRSVSLAWQQPSANSLRGAHLRVNYWKSRIRVPGRGQSAAGSLWDYAVGYVPHLSDSDEWVWRHDPNAVPDDDDDGLLVINLSHSDEIYSSHEMAENVVRHVFSE